MGIRIIAGKHKGLHIDAPRSARPTLSRFRESIFDILESFQIDREFGEFFSGKIVLDCFAGSGALGLEAISRGASHAYFVDRDRSAISVLHSNVNKLNTQENSAIIFSDIDKLKFSKKNQCCNVAFLDPPYFENISIKRTVEHLSDVGWISEKTILVIEQHIHSKDSLDFIEKIKSKTINNSIFTIGVFNQ
ncbi:RNA methyltransferase [Alphaproteobacteria bacterium]|nr:RNA methyltransferase [Alphaproteobacteria bacterium]